MGRDVRCADRSRGRRSADRRRFSARTSRERELVRDRGPHHNFARLGGLEAIPRTIERIASDANDVETRDIRDCALAIARRERDPVAFADAVAWEAWLRFTHAGMVASRPDYFPGQFKPVNNLLPSNCVQAPAGAAHGGRYVAHRDDTHRRRAATRRVACVPAVLRDRRDPSVRDGNGRLARYVLNSTLGGRGRFPSLRPYDDELGLARSIQRARRNDDIRGVAEAAAKGSALRSPTSTGNGRSVSYNRA
jgi:hypothetical protein